MSDIIMFAMGAIGLVICIIVAIALLSVGLTLFYVLGLCGVFGKKVEHWTLQKIQYAYNTIENKDGDNNV